jgi:hypothetical protein
MVHFPGLARTRLCIQRAVDWFCQYGFPHSEIPGSKPACGSPRLIAACHVLHRLLAPRHPPYALSSLTIKLTQHVPFYRDPVEPRWKVLQPFLAFTGFAPRVRAPLLAKNRGRARGGKFAFPHCAILEQICSCCITRTLTFAQCMPTSFSCQRSLFRSTVADRSISAPGGAQHRFGADVANNVVANIAATNKKPGVERRASPSIAWATPWERPLGRHCSNLDCFLPGVRNQPHLWMRRQTRFVRRNPNESEVHRHQESISIFGISSSINELFLQRSMWISQPLWKS